MVGSLRLRNRVGPGSLFLGLLAAPAAAYLALTTVMWRPISHAPDVELSTVGLALQEVVAADSGCGVLALGSGLLFVSTDWGRTWDPSRPSPQVFLAGVVRLGDRRLVGAGTLLGGEAPRGVAFWSVDLGSNWRRSAVPEGPQFDDVAACGTTSVVAVSSTTVVMSTDGENFGEVLRFDDLGQPTRVSCSTARGVWVSRADGSLMTSKDGASWAQDRLPTKGGGAYRIVFADDIAFAVGAGLLRENSPGSWTAVGGEDVAATSLLDLAFSGVRGVAVGEGGALFETRDRGLTWARRRSGTEESLLGVGWSQSGLPIAVRTGGVVIRKGLPRFCGGRRGRIGTLMWP